VLRASFEACREITRRAARNFYYGLRLTPEPRRSAVFSVYAWMRTADDQVDNAGDAAARAAALVRFRERTEAALSEGAWARGAFGAGEGEGAGAFWPAFAATVASYGVPRVLLDEMLAGLGEDTEHGGYETWDGVERYCYRVGSTVGLVCLRVWGLRDGADAARADALADARGRAFQLTNIVRDVGEDLSDTPMRLYLPWEALREAGVDGAGLRAWTPPERCRALVEGVIARAEGYYEASEGLEGLVDAECAPALWGMSRIYRSLLGVIAADPSKVVGSRRVRLSSARKGLIALSAVVRRRAGAWAS
jgi:phytoene synthase